MTAKRKYSNPDDIDPRFIAAHGIIVGLNISVPGLRRKDNNASAVAAAGMMADQTKAGAYTKALLDMRAPEVQAFHAAARMARDRHYQNAMPWDDTGRRYLPNTNYQKYTNDLREALLAFDKAKTEFLAAYPKLKEEAKIHLGQMYDEAQYPSISAMEAMFGFETFQDPVPAAQNFEIINGDVPPEAIEQFQKGVDERVRTTVAMGADELLNEAHDRIRRIADRLNEYDPNNKNSDCKHLREALFTNLGDMCNLLPKLNVLNDERIDALIEMIRNEVLRFDMKTLRADKSARKAVADKAQEVMDAMESWSST